MLPQTRLDETQSHAIVGPEWCPTEDGNDSKQPQIAAGKCDSPCPQYVESEFEDGIRLSVTLLTTLLQ
jgi:hypothetical protein